MRSISLITRATDGYVPSPKNATASTENGAKVPPCVPRFAASHPSCAKSSAQKTTKWACNPHSVVPIQLGPTGPEASLWCSGAQRHRFHDARLVWPVAPTSGIGTTNPGFKLDVATSGAGLQTAERIQNNVTAANNSGAQTIYAANRTASGLTNVAAVGGIITDITDTAYKGALVLSTANNAPPVERMRIDSNGNVGIGTSNPLAKLEVGGQLKVTGGNPAAGRVLTSDANGLAAWQAPSIPTQVVALSDGQTIAVDGSLGNVFTVTLGGNRVFSNPTNLAANVLYTFRITQDGTGGRIVGFGTAYKFSSAALPTMSTTASKTNVLVFVSDGTNLFNIGAAADAATWIPRSCYEILATNPSSGSGIYTIKPDGSGDMSAYCDMTTNGGGWTLVAASNPTNSTTLVVSSIPDLSSYGMLNSILLPAIANVSTTVRFSAPSYAAEVYSSGAYAITRLRSYLPLNDNANMWTPSANWISPPSNFTYSCATPDNIILSTSIYWACGNGGNGTHWLPSWGGVSYSKFSNPDAPTALRLWVK